MEIHSPCGRTPPFIPRSNRSRTDTFPMWADAPPDWARAADKKSVFLIRTGAPYARMRHRPAAGGFPVRAHGNARNAGRGKPCGTALIPGAQKNGGGTGSHGLENPSDPADEPPGFSKRDGHGWVERVVRTEQERVAVTEHPFD